MNPTPSQPHYSPREWELMLRGYLPASTLRTMALHLESCADCGAIVRALDNPPFTGATRPASPHFALTPRDIETRIRSLTQFVQQQLPRGGVLYLTCESASETALYYAITLASRRLARSGIAATIQPALFDSIEEPAPPAEGVAFLLDAQAFQSIREWEHSRAAIVTILTGWNVEWSPPQSIHFPVFIPEPQPTYSARVNRAWLRGDERIRTALLIGALGVDLPLSFLNLDLADHLELPFEQIQTQAGERLPYFSTWGQYSTFDALRHTVCASDWETACHHPELDDARRLRLAHRLALRRQAGLILA